MAVAWLRSVRSERHVEGWNGLQRGNSPFGRVDGVDDRYDFAERQLVARVEHRLIERAIARIAMRPIGGPFCGNPRTKIGEAPLLAYPRDLERIDDGRSLPPSERERAVGPRIHVQAWFWRRREAIGAARHERIRVDARHVRPYGRDEQERYATDYEIDHGYHVDLVVGRSTYTFPIRFDRSHRHVEGSFASHIDSSERRRFPGYPPPMSDDIRSRVDRLELPWNSYGSDPYGISKEDLGWFFET